MRVRVFTLKYSILTGGFDDSEVRAFIADKEVQAIHDHAFVHQEFSPLGSGGALSRPQRRKFRANRKEPANPPEESWRKVLTDEDILMNGHALPYSCQLPNRRATFYVHVRPMSHGQWP